MIQAYAVQKAKGRLKRIEPMTEIFPMSRVNDALAHLRANKARYRIVLENDFAGQGSVKF